MGHYLRDYDVRCGSDSDLDAPQREVRFAPINGNRQSGAARPICAHEQTCDAFVYNEAT
jgi:hypothetical protein